jgi:Tol biopolymer transport system component
VRVAIAIVVGCLVVGCGPAATEGPREASPDDTGLIVFNGFHSDREASGFEYWVMRPDGSGLRQLENQEDALSFSPGGQFIVTLTIQETAGDSVDLIVVSRPDGSEQRRVNVPDPSGTAGWPSVSADGKRVAFVFAPDPAFTGPRNLWTVSVGGDDFKQLSSTGEVWMHAWSPDGERLVFMDEHREDIYVVHADGTELHHLAQGGDPAWSPDGKRIAFSHRGQIMVVDADGGTPVVVSANGRMPSWSPDGTELAYVADTGPCGQVMCNGVFVAELDDGHARRVGPELAEASYLAWTTARIPTAREAAN